MLNRAKRIIIYVVVDVVLGFVGILVGLLPIEYSWGAAFIILGVIISAILEILIEITKEETIPVDVIYGERELKQAFRNLRKGACEMRAVWCSKYAEVSKYFEDESKEFKTNKKLKVKRLINPNIVPTSDYEEHLKNTERLRKSKKYIVKTTELTELECVICEYEIKDEKSWKALFVFVDTDTFTPALGILFDPVKKPKSKTSLAAVSGWFEDEWKRGNPI